MTSGESYYVTQYDESTEYSINCSVQHWFECFCFSQTEAHVLLNCALLWITLILRPETFVLCNIKLRYNLSLSRYRNRQRK